MPSAAPVTSPSLTASATSRQRASGVVRLRFSRAGSRSEAASVYETGGLRVRFPRSVGECEAVIVNTGGGMAGGDRADVVIDVEPGARAIVTTQAAEKVYRSGGSPTNAVVALTVGSGSSLTWAPQETLLFGGAEFARRFEASVAADASLLIVESVVFGRLAHGETRIEADFRDDWRIRRDGRIVHAESLRLCNAGARLDSPAVGGGARSLATLLLVDARAEARLEDLRQTFSADSGAVEIGASAFDGLLVARLAAANPQRLRFAVTTMMSTLRGRDAPRVWA